MTEEERIATIKNAVLASQGFQSASVDEFVAEVKTEEIVSRHGLLDAQKEDIEDEKQFLNSDSAEDIEEEDQDMGVVSDQMKGVYQS
ncbi:MAG: hypothetical protein CBC05_08885 [Crocinitomicaceae bacterium TMED45]|nr:MAG: hypothetical protein CBC05_08885 [Crocinitomicaceae bacterium TMED45]|tara:strand:- start:8078 stop:8338 length:261 start_codon:yes stop_codon:yes gene_type:complete